jgi:2-(1,2-epoxy-1,2-dihydrophenyl)acetyl-CoA isomerase
MEGTVEVHREGGTLLLTLSRPSKLNALSPSLVEGLNNALALARAPDVRVVLLAGEGSSFCAGGDVNQLGSDNLEAGREYIASVTELLAILRGFPKPIVAAVQGYAVGAGAEIACEADLILMATDAVLRFSDVTISSTPATVYRLVRLVGLGMASRMVLLGEDLDAQRALELGLAHSVVATEQLMAAAGDVAQRLCDLSSLSLRLAKQALRLAQATDGFTDLWLNLEAEIACYSSPQMRDLMKRFSRGAPRSSDSA